MRIQPIANNYDVSQKGQVSKNTAEFVKRISDSWLDASANGKYKTLPIINTCLSASERVNNVFLNLSTIMERFCSGCELSFVKSEKSGKYRFFIEHKSSNYKAVCGDAEFSPKMNKLSDVNELERIENKVAKLNPYEENTHFIVQRKPDSKTAMQNSEFIPDADYIFLEDKLIKRDYEPATMDDIEEFVNAAKEEGLING